MDRQVPRAMLCAVLLLASAVVAGAQGFTGGVRGEVRDQNGVIPGVTVTLVNEATNISREVVTNAVGQYNFPAVAPGTYTLKTQLTGYKTYESKGLIVGTQQFVTLDVVLQVGALEESITVTGQSPLIDTSTASTGGVLDKEALESLPAPGRNAFLIGVTVPTVMPTGDPQFNRQQDQTNASRVSMGGGGIRANNYLLDGVPISELRGRAVLNPTMEAVEEVKVQVHTYDSEMGRTGGGVFNVTMRSGTNNYHGSGFYQTRPVWGQSQNFFNSTSGLTKEETGEDTVYYRLYGGGAGGPIKKDRTFFWAATEGYRSGTTRNQQEVWPTTNQRNGDFSHTTVNGAPVVLYNPWCRGGVANARCPATGTGSIATGGLFTGAIIPLTHPAVSQVGLNIMKLWPTETIQGPMAQNENGEANAIGTANVVDMADMFTGKIEHKITQNFSLSGSYIYNRTNEPGSTIMKADKLFMADQDQWFGPLRRRPHVLTVNATDVLNDRTVLTMRYGFSTWQDSCDKQAFTPGLQSLGFASSYVNALGPGGSDTFPSLYFDKGTEAVGGWGGYPVRWKSPVTINAGVTHLRGSHSYKFGGDFRRMGLAIENTVSLGPNGPPALGGSFQFNNLFTGNNGTGGHELASLLLGLPYAGDVPATPGAGEWYLNYWGGYAQDDWRVNSNLTLNYGVRIEREDGLREINNQQTVAFDRNAVNPIDALVPKTGLLAGQTLRGGLVYAGVNGANTYQGDPPRAKVAPRVGMTYAINKDTVLRAGYGLFYAPWNYSTTHHGQIGFARTTSLAQTPSETAVPITVLDNPFPAIQQPTGSSLGLLTGVGGNIEFVDQTKGAPKVHQYSVDVQRELPGNMAVTIGYVGASGRDIGYAGTAESTAININQIDPAVARARFPGPNGSWNAAALRALVPNPFFGVAGAGELGSQATIAQGQLLRPFPEFGDINMIETTAGGRRQYNGLTATLDKRTGSTGWGGRLSYTFSKTMDNQFGQDNVYQTRTQTPQNNYDLDAEYSVSNFDSPHRIILAPIYVFPSPGARATSKHLLLGGWTASAVVELVSGAPLNTVLSQGASDANLGLLGGRQRPNLIGDPNTSGSDQDRVSDALHPDARFFTAAAFANPGAGVYGNAPRTDGDARYQFRRNVDLVLAKQVPFAGNQSGEIRFEWINLTNTPKFNGIDSNAIDSQAYGRITTQAGFMRIWQLSFRYRF